MKLFRVIGALTILLVFLPLTAAQFGVPKAAEQEATIDGSGNVVAEGEETTENKYAKMAIRLQSAAPIDVQDAVDIAAILEAAQADPETKAMIAKMKQGEEGKMIDALAKDVTGMEIVHGLKQSLDELKALEILFADPERAVVEMEKEGLIEKKRVEFYKKNPEALADETRKGIYFGFVSMAVAGGFLE